jgi:G:T-mismatch repair DNA endonuclease (very short patch repair protein)
MVVCAGCGSLFECQGSYKRQYCTKECMVKYYSSALVGEKNPNFRHGPKHCEGCNKQISKNAKRFCRKCQGERNKGEGNPFYGKCHSEKTRSAMSENHNGNAHWIGRKHSTTSRTKMSLSQKKLMKCPERREKARAVLLAATKKQMQFAPTKPELAVAKLLSDKGIRFETNKKMYGKFLVDFYLPTGTIIEVFGDYWHSNPIMFPNPNAMQKLQMKKDTSRLAYLRKCGHNAVVLWEHDILRAPEVVVKLLADNEIYIGAKTTSS